MVSRTIIEWHSIDELPKDSGSYMIKLNDGSLMNVNYSSKYQKFNVMDSFSKKEVKKISIENDVFVAWGEVKEEN